MMPSIRRRSLVVLVALALLPLGYRLFEARAMTRPGPVVTAQSPVTAVRVPAPRPTARDILAAGLELTVDQRRALDALARAWERDAAPLDRRVAAARADLQAFMAAHQGRTTITELQDRSAELRAAGAELRERRERHSTASQNVLTTAQRDALRRVSASGGAQ